ncbi:MAG: hypothetical protein IJN40_07530 [Clostridia bacterium]|nr:hypothetical protein [Clostridia bacterium]
MNVNTYYLSANTGGGHVSFFDDLLNSFRKIIVLKDFPPDYKKIIFDEVTKALDDGGFFYDKIISCATSDSIAALIIDSLSTAVADEEIITTEIPLYADVIDFTDIINCDYEEKKNLSFSNEKINKLKRKMVSHLTEAKKIHDEWEKIYISNLDFDKINNEADKLISSLLDGEVSKDGLGSDCSRFFGTLLTRGNINYIDKLTDNFIKRIFIKGRPGTGKSTILKKFASAAREKGYNTETYYCSLDTKSVDMIVVRELGIAAFDSTSPHEKFPQRPGDEIFDVYEIGKKTNIDDYYSDELMMVSNQYNDEIKKAKECLYTILALKNGMSKLLRADNSVLDSLSSKIINMSSICK